MLHSFFARLLYALKPHQADQEVIHERMEQFVGVDMPITARYKIERQQVHGELSRETMVKIWPVEQTEYFVRFPDHKQN